MGTKKTKSGIKTAIAKKSVKRTESGAGTTDDLKEQLRLKDIEIMLYREVGALMTKGADINTFLGRVMDFALEALCSDKGTLYLLDESKEELVFEIVKGPGSDKLTGLRIRKNMGIAGYVASTGKPYVCGDLKADSKWLGLRFDDGQENLNMVAVPLKFKGGMIGVIGVMGRTNDGIFKKKDVATLTSIADHCSIILERRGLFVELDSKLKQFSTLTEIGKLLNSTLDEKVVRERAMGAITGLMDAEAGSLLMVDAATNELYFDVALGDKGAAVKTIRLKMGEGVAGWVAEKGESVIIHDVANDPRFFSKADKKSEFKTRNMVCVPVKVKGAVIGVLQAINKKSGRFGSSDMELFHMFSNQVAIAIDNARLYQELKNTFWSASMALAEAIEKRDPYTGGHTKRVLQYSVVIAKELGISEAELEDLRLSAVLHDIGKIGVDDAVLRKQGPLDENERAMMSRHPEMGKSILAHVSQLTPVMPGMLYHHERPDGKGYPEGLTGEQIHLQARIIAIADTYDAMTSTRPYRKGLPREVAVAELKKHSGTQFDPKAVEAFLRAIERGDIDGIVP